jgi:hypothetical protein
MWLQNPPRTDLLAKARIVSASSRFARIITWLSASCFTMIGRGAYHCANICVAFQSGHCTSCSLLEEMEWSSLRWEDAGAEEKARLVNAWCRIARSASNRGNLTDALSLLTALQRFKLECTTLVTGTIQVHPPNSVCLTCRIAICCVLGHWEG